MCVLIMYVQVRDNYLLTIDNIQQADADVIVESQVTMNTTLRQVHYRELKIIPLVLCREVIPWLWGDRNLFTCNSVSGFLHCTQ